MKFNNMINTSRDNENMIQTIDDMIKTIDPKEIE